MPQVNAGTPEKNLAFVPPARTVTNRAVCIDPGGDAPCFTLNDLRERAPKWVIPPPVWDEYPASLDDVPLVTRTYSPETIEYLANERTVTRSTGGIESTVTWTYQPESGGTRVTFNSEYTVPVPLLGKLAERYIVKANESETELVLSNLKDRMEV